MMDKRIVDIPIKAATRLRYAEIVSLDSIYHNITIIGRQYLAISFSYWNYFSKLYKRH